MAKVDYPLFGTEASGSIHHLVNFSNQWEWAIVRGHISKKDSPSPAQLAHRALYRTALSTWVALSSYEKNEHTSQAPEGWSGLNYFIHLFINT